MTKGPLDATPPGSVDIGRRGGTDRTPRRRYRPRPQPPPPGLPVCGRQARSQPARAGRRGSGSARDAARRARSEAGPARRAQPGAAGGCDRRFAAVRAGQLGRRGAYCGRFRGGDVRTHPALSVRSSATCPSRTSLRQPSWRVPSRSAHPGRLSCPLGQPRRNRALSPDRRGDLHRVAGRYPES
jgi:hypothetical protein